MNGEECSVGGVSGSFGGFAGGGGGGGGLVAFDIDAREAELKVGDTAHPRGASVVFHRSAVVPNIRSFLLTEHPHWFPGFWVPSKLCPTEDVAELAFKW